MRLSCVLVLVTAVVLTNGAVVSRSREARLENYKRLLGQYFLQPRHPFINEESWLYARQGIESELTQILQGIPRAKLEIQHFETEVFVETNVPAPVHGQNIIVTLEGSKFGTMEDQILLIGAHYDSDSSTLGISDNGSGVVALLEVARTLAALIRSGQIQLKYTVMFAAFDVQKLEYEITGTLDRSSGSHYFVREMLDGILNRPDAPRFRGALIMDSVLNYNTSANTQILPDGFSESFPAAFQQIVQRNHSGNYLALVSKENLRSARLDQMFSQHWAAVDTSTKYPAVICEILRSTASLASFEFLKQDHLSFWNYMQNNQARPLPAILLTDTGKWRGMPSHCALRSCHVDELLDSERLAFLDQMVLTINRIISHNQFESLPEESDPGNNASNQLPVNVMSILLLAAVSLLLH